MPDRIDELAGRLAGGDRRTIGAADTIAAEASAGRVDPADLVVLMADHQHPDVRMRAADALEKVARTHPELIQPHRDTLIELLGRAHQQEVRWHLAQLMRHLHLGPEHASAIVAALVDYLDDTSSIVRTEALHTLILLEHTTDHTRKDLAQVVARAIRDGTPAMRARARRLAPPNG